MAGVLVIDDDEAIRTLLVELLTSEGHQVDAAVGEAALALAGERPPDLIFLDLMMPDLDGFAIIQRLQADPRTRAVPVVVMSASYLLRQHEQTLAVHGVLPKPFDLMDVLAWVERLVPDPLTSRPALDAPELVPPKEVGADEAGAVRGL
jgi:CheY-like chemotaxis protein